MIRLIFCALFLIISNSSLAEARICTQNLFNFGKFEAVQKRLKKSKSQLELQELALAKRIIDARCELVAVQEVISRTPKEAEETLQILSDRIFKLTKKRFGVISGKSNDPLAKLGYLYRKDLFKINFSKSYSYYLLPHITKHDKNRYFSRGPLRIDIDYLPSNTKLSIFTFHFKSVASYHSYDSSGYRYEYDRIQMAQGLFDIASEVSRSRPDNIIVLLGDRNSSGDSASGQVLSGEINLNYFTQKVCQLSESSMAYCPKSAIEKSTFFSLINKDPDVALRQKMTMKKYSFIDDLLISTKDLDYAREKNKNNDYQVDFIKPDLKASDHPLFFVDLEI